MGLVEHPACLPIASLLQGCTVRRQRRSGPGGQHRNKVETAIVIVHNATQLRGEASERRSQADNLANAILRLRIKLAIHVRSQSFNLAEYQPSALWLSRLQGGRVIVSGEHADFPSLLAEVSQLLAQTDYEIPATASYLQCSSSQLLKFLKLATEAWQTVNRERQLRNKHPLQ